MTQDNHPDQVPHGPRTNVPEIQAAPHAAVARVDDLESAETLMEDLEGHGIPSSAIKMVRVLTGDSRHVERGSEVTDSPAFAATSTSAIVGVSLGIVIGGLLGLLLADLISSFPLEWGLVLGALFGAALGGTIGGGLSKAKVSSSPSEGEYEIKENDRLGVAVHHEDKEMVNQAEDVMRRHVPAEDIVEFENPPYPHSA